MSVILARQYWSFQDDRHRSGNDLSKYRSHGSGIQSHELEGECDQLVYGGSDSPQIEILQNRRVTGKKHVVHWKILALSRVDRGRIYAEQTETTPEQRTDARFGKRWPVFRKSAAGDGSSSAKKQSLYEWQRLDLLEILHLDFFTEAGDIDDDSGTVEGVERELVRA